MIDAQGRPYFLWDCDLTLEGSRKRLADAEVRACLVGKLMRQAKPDDVFLFVRAREIHSLLGDAVGLAQSCSLERPTDRSPSGW